MRRSYRSTIVLTFFIISGCSTVQKTELRDIFSDVRDEKFDSAEERFVPLASAKFSTYDNKTIDGDDRGFSGRTVRWYLNNAASYIRGCRSFLNRMDAIQVQPGWDKDRIHSAKLEVESISSDFDANCLLKGDRTGRDDFIQELTNVSSVDLSRRRPEFEARFREKKRRVLVELGSSERHRESDKQSVEATQREFEESPGYFEQKMCELTGLISQARRRIAQEHEIGRTSGIVDAVVLHRNGQRIQTFESQLNSIKQRYREKFGKPWSGSACD